ncbi:MAG: diguanylate cyclase [Candidatus Aegiribacteria sp.]|nr:diguanylate cyclase [Candidatus Aegiribacteria sp.]
MDDNIRKEYIDDLTGLFNRRYLNMKAREYFQINSREPSPTSILLIDLDHFKNVNDTYGHSMGDTVLNEFSSFLEELVRGNDSVFRYGGDEFVCILPQTAYEHAERISSRFIESCRVKEFSRVRLTLSIGIASFPHDGEEWTDLFNIADQRLYSAKRHGRDRVGVPVSGRRNLAIPTKEIVGRGVELSEVIRSAGPSSDNHGGAFCISGEIGVGKSRLAGEIVDTERFGSYRFFGSILSATTHSIPYFPFRELVRSMVRTDSGLCLKDIPRTYRIELAKIVPELSDSIGESGEEVLIVDKFRLFEGVRRLFEQQVANSPIIISIDNIHWADEGSLELLNYVIRAFRDSKILFLLIYRIEEADKECFQRILNNMSREGLFSRITLEPLKEADVSRMLSLIIDRIPPLELTEYIYKQTGGNPFFIEELMKTLYESGALYWGNDKWTFSADRVDRIPYSIKDVIDRKLDMISAEASDLIEHAAVIGREFDFSFMLELADWNEGHLFDLMDEALKVGLLKEYDGERFFFPEDVIRETVYNGINGARRKRFHLTIAQKQLDIHKEEVEQVVEDLSTHFYKGGDTASAIEHSISAGDKARDSYAYREAVKYYNRAIECFGTNETRWSREKIECTMNRAVALGVLGENEQAIHDLQEVILQSDRISDRELEADGLLHICKPYLDIGEYNRALETAEEAEKISKEIENNGKVADALNNSGLSCWHLGRYHDAVEYYERSMVMLDGTGEETVSPSKLNNIGAVYWNLGEYNRAMDYFKRSLEITERIGDIKTNAACLNNCGLIHWGFCEYRKALEYFIKSLEITEKIGNRNSITANLNNIGKAYEYFSEYSKSLEYLNRSLAISREIGDRRTESTILANMSDINRILGEYEVSLELINDSLIIRNDTGDRRGVMECMMSEGDTLFMMNNLESARKFYMQSRDIAVEIDAASQIKGIDIGILSLDFEENRLEGLEEGITDILHSPEESVGRNLKAAAHQLAGRLHSRMHDWNRSIESFEESEVIFKESDDNYNLAVTLYYKGQMLGESGNEDGLKECYSRAKEIFTRINAKGWLKHLQS